MKTTKRTTYSMTELKAWFGKEAWQNAINYIKRITGITDDYEAWDTADTYQILFLEDGTPANT